MQTLAVRLRDERRMLGALIYRITVLRHLVASGEARFVGRAADEARRAWHAVELAGSARQVAARDAADEARITEPISLLKLAARAEGPFAQHLSDIRVEMAADVDEIDELVASTRNFAHRALEEIAATYTLVSTDPAYAEPPNPEHLSYRGTPQAGTGRLASPAVLEPLTMTAEHATLAAAERRLQQAVEVLAAVDLRPTVAFLG